MNPRDAIYMGIDRIEHFLGGDAILSTRNAYASLEQLDVSRPEVDAVIQLYLKRNVFYDATVSAYGYWYDPKDPRVFTTWMDEMSFLTPHARTIAKSRLPRKPVEQFRRIYEVKFKELKRFYDAGGARLITLGTDHPSWGEFLSGFSAHREVQAFVLAGIPPAAALKMATINGARALRLGDVLGTIEPGKLADLFVVRGNPLQDITTTRRVQRVMARGTLYDAAALLASVKEKMGPAGPADDDWWKGNVRLRNDAEPRLRSYSSRPPSPILLHRGPPLLALEPPRLRSRRRSRRAPRLWVASRPARQRAEPRPRRFTILRLRPVLARFDHDPAIDRHRLPARASSRAFTSLESGASATFRRRSTAVATLLTFCPPGPEARTNFSTRKGSRLAIGDWLLLINQNPRPRTRGSRGWHGAHGVQEG